MREFERNERRERLTVVECSRLPDGKHSDGESPGLRLVVRGETRAWTLAYTSPATGKRREIGLGTLAEVGLAKARKHAAELRDKVRKGVDPIEEAKARRAAGKAAAAAEKVAEQSTARTLRRVAREFHEVAVEPKLKHAKDASRWINSIETHLPAALLDKPIGSIRAAELLDALRPIYRKHHPTAKRIRQNLDAVFDDAVLREIVPANPVKVVARPLRDEKHTPQNWRALPYAEVPAFVARLRALPGTAARALEFAVLTAARTSEVIDMEWGELSPDGRTWTVPASRMKGGEEHVVHLSDAARAVLDLVRGKHKSIVFPSPTKADAPLSNMAMLILLRRLEIADRTTVHGVCRSSFSTWANETGAARPDVIEACLAHSEADKVRAAYNRAKFADERRELLTKWAAFAAPLPKERKTADVLSLPKRRAK